MFMPTVTEVVNGYEYRYDIFSRLLKDRIIYISGQIDSQLCAVVNSQLLFLAHTDPKAPIKIYMDSPGGSVVAGLSTYDIINFIPNTVEIVAVGQCASMAAFLLSSGTKGYRKALPNSRILIHQPLGGVSGQASDIEIGAKEILRLKDLLNQILAKNTNQPLEKIQKDTDRDYILTAEEAKAYGLIDEIVQNKSA